MSLNLIPVINCPIPTDNAVPSTPSTAGQWSLWHSIAQTAKKGAIALLILILSGVLVVAMGWFSPAYAAPEAATNAVTASSTEGDRPMETLTATFAGGCFWCMEHPFDALPGVLDTTSGYTGGTVENPSYEQVSSGTTGHVESVQVTYNPERIGYNELLEVYWRNVDPLDGNGQFCDRGNQYRPIIFYENEEQRQLAETSKQALEESGTFDQPIATEIIPASTFYPAEDYHQNYYQTHSLRYRFYRYACGRDQRLSQVWDTVDSMAEAE